MKRLLKRKIVRFLISGGSAAIVEFSVFLLFREALDINLQVANVLSFSCGLVTSFLLNKYWVFGSNATAAGEFVRYAVLAGINLCISTLILTGLVHIGMPAPISKIFVMGLIAVSNYFIFGKLIFKQRDSISEKA